MVSVFLDEKMMPVPDVLSGVMPPMAKLMMSGMLKKGEVNPPGDAFGFLEGSPSDLAWTPTWASGSASVAVALIGFSSLVEQAASERLDPKLLSVVGAAIESWHGDSDVSESIKLASNTLPQSLHTSIKLALFTVAVSYRVDDALLLDVSGQVDSGGDEAILALVSWAAELAARRCAGWTSSSWSFGD